MCLVFVDPMVEGTLPGKKLPRVLILDPILCTGTSQYSYTGCLSLTGFFRPTRIMDINGLTSTSNINMLRQAGKMSTDMGVTSFRESIDLVSSGT